MKKERLQKILSNLGVGSRRFIEKLIKTNNVKVNGKINLRKVPFIS